eukprot:s3822_g3.t1
MSKSAKQSARVLMVMGLESTTLRGVAAVHVSMLDDDGLSSDGIQCFSETSVEGGEFPHRAAMFFFFMVVIALVAFLWKTYRTARDAYVSFEQNCTDVAAAESLIERLRAKNPAVRQQFDDMQGSINRLQRAHNELESQDEMLSDMVGGLHYGIVTLGGYTNHSDLTPVQRQRMFRVEQANLVAARTMGSNRYMATVIHQNRGVAVGDDTDMDAAPVAGASSSSVAERGESEDLAYYPEVPPAPPVSNLAQVHETFRNELNISAFLLNRNKKGPCCLPVVVMEGYYSRFDSSDLEKALSEDLAGHSTQGAHGLNYHHKPPGDEGQTFFMPCKSIMGQGAMKGAVSQIKALGHKKALIVTDAVLVKVGAVKALTDTLDQSGIAYGIYDGCEPNPTCGQVEAGLKKIKEEQCDFVISFGGGSPHDCAKAIALTATNGGDIRQMEGVDKSTKPMMTMVAVNTTAGTGAEMTRFCIITDETRHVKMAIVDWRVTPTLAVNDPKTMIGMPKSLTAATGMDALTHAIEAYVSTASNPVTDACAVRAIKLISSYLPTAVEDGKNVKARDMMAYAEFLAGMAFNSAGLGYVHAMAHQLGGMYNMPHGVCNAILLGPVEKYNAKYVPELFIDIAAALGFQCGEDKDLAVTKVLECIKLLKNRIGIPKNLKAFPQVKVEDFPLLAENAMKDACGATNPHQPNKEEVIQLFQDAYDQEDDECIEVANLQQQLAAAAARCKDSAVLKKAMEQLQS